MVILALDTTTRIGSCAVVRDGTLLAEQASAPELPPAARLPADLMRLLERCGLPLGAVDAFAVATGPGSFTGLRIGIATMQGLAFAGQRPLIGVSGFDALAAAVAEQASGRLVATWVDAWRGEVYAALYDHDREASAPVVENPAALLDDLRTSGHRLLFVGDGAATFRPRIEEELGERAAFAGPMTPLLAGQLGVLAHDRMLAGERPRPHAITPLYVRRPDAELARARR